MPLSPTSALTLDSGRKIRLREIQQQYTYAGMLCGFPTTEKNARTLAYLAEPQKGDEGMPRFVIRPVETPMEHVIKRLKENPDPFYEGKIPASLPDVVCTAVFYADEITGGEDGHMSALVVVWFQEDFAFPIDPVTLRQIQALDWDKLARNFCF